MSEIVDPVEETVNVDASVVPTETTAADNSEVKEEIEATVTEVVPNDNQEPEAKVATSKPLEKPVLPDVEEEISQFVGDNDSFTQKIAALVLWQNPRTSGGTFFVGNFLWYLIQVRGYSVLTLTSYATMLLVLSNLVFVKIHPLLVFFKFAKDNENPQSMVIGANATVLDENAIADVVRQAAAVLNKVYAAFGKTVLQCKSTKLTLAALGLLNFISLIGRCMSLPAAAYTLFLLVFTIPRAYMQKKAEFDQVLAIALKKLNQLIEDGLEAAKPAMSALQPYLSKVQMFSSSVGHKMKGE